MKLVLVLVNNFPCVLEFLRTLFVDVSGPWCIQVTLSLRREQLPHRLKEVFMVYIRKYGCFSSLSHARFVLCGFYLCNYCNTQQLISSFIYFFTLQLWKTLVLTSLTAETLHLVPDNLKCTTRFSVICETVHP